MTIGTGRAGRVASGSGRRAARMRPSAPATSAIAESANSQPNSACSHARRSAIAGSEYMKYTRAGLTESSSALHAAGQTTMASSVSRSDASSMLSALSTTMERSSSGAPGRQSAAAPPSDAAAARINEMVTRRLHAVNLMRDIIDQIEQGSRRIFAPVAAVIYRRRWGRPPRSRCQLSAKSCVACVIL